MENNLTISTKIIINEARNRGIVAEPIGPSRVVKLSFGGHDEYLSGSVLSVISGPALRIVNMKDQTKEFLKLNGIAVVDGKRFRNSELTAALSFAKEIGFPVVLKPTDSSHGNCVFIDISSEAEFNSAWANISSKFENIIVEKFFENGIEYRITATKEKVLAITKRVPANVVGDGKHTIQELIDIKNSDLRRGDDSYRDFSRPLVKIEIDDVVLGTLLKDNLALDTVLKNDRQLFLRQNSNLSTGGDSVDFTDKADPSVKEISVKAINSIPGLAYGGIDFICHDIAQPQDKKSYSIIEINGSPGIFMHHFPYEGTPRNVAGGILDLAFPETRKDAR